MNRRVYNCLRKQAGLAKETLLGLGLNGLPAGLPINDVAITGMLSDLTAGNSASELRSLEKMNPLIQAIPFIGPTSMAMLRDRLTKNILSETRKNQKDSPLIRIGMAPASLLGWPVALAAAAITKRRSFKEQLETSNDPHFNLKRLLIPGYASYDKLKTMGVSEAISTGNYDDKDLEGLPEKIKKVLLDNKRAILKESKKQQ